MTQRLPIEDPMAEALATYPPQVRSLMLEVLTIRDNSERAREIGDLHQSGIAPATAELLIDAEQDPALRAVLVGILREM